MPEWIRRAVVPFTADPPPEFVAELDTGDGGRMQATVYGDGTRGPINLFLSYLSPLATTLPDTLSPRERQTAVVALVEGSETPFPSADHLARFPTFEEVRTAVDALLPEGVVLQLPHCHAMGKDQVYAPLIGVGSLQLLQAGVAEGTPAAAGIVLAGPGMELPQ